MADPETPGQWVPTSSLKVQQGDFFRALRVPLWSKDLVDGEESDVTLQQSDGIVITHTCHIRNREPVFVALCAATDLVPYMKKHGHGTSFLNDVKADKRPGFHLLTAPDSLGGFLLVDFDLILTVPRGILEARLKTQGEHWTLDTGPRDLLSHRFGECYGKPVSERLDVPAEIIQQITAAQA